MHQQQYMVSGAVVLAGGQSRRMGTPKAWLDWGGRPLLQHLLELIGSVCRDIVVVGASGQELPPLPRGARRVDDPPEHPSGGPLVGLATGLTALASQGIEIAFLAACDGVFLSAEHVTYVMDTLLQSPLRTGVLPIDDRPPHYAHPLASSVRVLPAAKLANELVQANVRRPIRLFDRLRADKIKVSELPDPRVVKTCNTPEAYRAAHLEAWGTQAREF